jgi:hypothetical protein
MYRHALKHHLGSIMNSVFAAYKDSFLLLLLLL